MASYIIDLENTSISHIEKAKLNSGDRVFVFYTSDHAEIPTATPICLTSNHAMLRYIKLGGEVSSLSMVISSYIGYLIASGTETQITIVSGDATLDGVIAFWRDTNPQITVKRTVAQGTERKKSGGSGAEKKKNAQKPCAKAAGNASGKSTDKATGNAPAKAADKASVKAADKSANKAADKAKDKAAGKNKNDPRRSSDADTKIKSDAKRSRTDGGAKLIESDKSKKLRVKLRAIGLDEPAFTKFLNIYTKAKNKQELNISLVRAFTQETGNRIYRSIVKDFDKLTSRKSDSD